MSRLRVLAVVNDPVLMNLYYALLAERGHRFRGFRSVHALDQLKDVDVLVVDVQARQSSGRAILEAVRSSAEYEDLPLLVVGESEDTGTVGFRPNEATLPRQVDIEKVFVDAVESLAATSDKRDQGKSATDRANGS